MRRVCSETGCPGEAISKGRCAEHARQANRRYTSEYKPQYNGCDRLAVDVHHANGHEDFYGLEGLEALCKEHHGEVTRVEQTGRRATL
jgi:hypothetical protein